MIVEFKKQSSIYTLIAIAGFLLFGWVSLTSAVTPAGEQSVSLSARSERMVKLLAHAQYAAAVRDFDKNLSQALPPEKLKAVWGDVIQKNGNFKGIRKTRAGREAGFDIIFVTCGFANGPLDIKLVYNQNAQISGMWFVPAPPGD